MRARLGDTVWGAVAWIAGIAFVFPVIWMVLTSFKQEQDAASNPPSWVFTPTLAQYGQVFDRNITPFLLNSLMASVFSTLFVVLLATPAAYALSLRPVAKWTDTLFFFISTKMMPAVAALLPIYLLVKHLGMLDNIWTMVVLYTSMNLPLAVWMMRSFLLEVPREVLEAGEVDGAGLLTSIRKIILPIVSPGLAATAGIILVLMKKNSASVHFATGRSESAYAAGVASSTTRIVEKIAAISELSRNGVMLRSNTCAY